MQFQFKARNAASSYPELMRIRSDGKVGIGTDNPQKKLHVLGTSDFIVDTFFCFKNWKLW